MRDVTMVTTSTPPPGCDLADNSRGGCIPDEYAALVREIRVESGLVGTQKYHLKSYKEVLVGRELVQWLGRKKGMSEWRGGVIRGRA